MREYPATATRRNSDTISDSIINLGSELYYEMAHEQRLIFERRYCRGHRFAYSIILNIGPFRLTVVAARLTDPNNLRTELCASVS